MRLIDVWGAGIFTAMHGSKPDLYAQVFGDLAPDVADGRFISLYGERPVTRWVVRMMDGETSISPTTAAAIAGVAAVEFGARWARLSAAVGAVIDVATGTGYTTTETTDSSGTSETTRTDSQTDALFGFDSTDAPADSDERTSSGETTVADSSTRERTLTRKGTASAKDSAETLQGIVTITGDDVVHRAMHDVQSLICKPVYC